MKKVNIGNTKKNVIRQAEDKPGRIKEEAPLPAPTDKNEDTTTPDLITNKDQDLPSVETDIQVSKVIPIHKIKAAKKSVPKPKISKTSPSIETPIKVKKIQAKKASTKEPVDKTVAIKKEKTEKPKSNLAEKASAKFKMPVKASTEINQPLINQDDTISVLKTSAEKEQRSSTLLKKIIFQVKYTTIAGQSLYVTGNHPLLGDKDYEKAFPLNYLNDIYWYGALELSDSEKLVNDITYNYLLKDVDGTLIVDWGSDKVINVPDHPVEEILLLDTWNPASLIENTFYTEPFREVLLKENFTEVPVALPATTTHVFKVKFPMLLKGQAICLTGSSATLGEWNAESTILLSRMHGNPWHTVSLDLAETDFPIAYKYGVFDTESKQLITLEQGKNRVLYESYSKDKFTILSDGFVNVPYQPFKGAGVAIPVFSLRSNQGFGVGEFNDLKLLTDWAKTTGLKLIQLLPVNDTTATHTHTDSYPYAAISAFALHPLYLHLPSIVSKSNHTLLLALNDKKEELNGKTDVDYVAVMAAKWDLLKEIFPLQKDKTFKSSDFHAFFVENEHWLVPYAAFSNFREKYNTSDFSQWPANNVYNENDIHAIASSPLKAENEISIYYYVQYHLHLQLKDATEYAHKHGVILKGDIPIGIGRNSCDAWQQPELYNMDKQAGAPPDSFAVKGQNWGFPTYNWQRMRQDGFEWWKKRFRQMSYYFDAFRIDHILGFFRIWSIPLHAVEGIMGNFVPAIPVHINEFHSRHIFFDHNRFCKPFITHDTLQHIFSNDCEEVKSRYLDFQNDDRYSLKPEFDTQRKVEAHFAKPEYSDQDEKIKSGLYDLISNVILLEEEGSNGQQFHFRIAMDSTSSFRYLDDYTQQQLRSLYLDYFFKRQDEFWKKEAMQKLPELKRSTNMLICGEDLGMVPASVPGVMRNLAILSLEIQRMPKDPKKSFFHPADAPYLSVVTPSTHDMSTIRGWWEEDRATTQQFFNNELGQWGTAPYFCEPWINQIILLQHFHSPAMWSIFQLQDLMGINPALRRENPHEERINIPADPKHYWRYRMHITLEELLKEESFSNEIKNYVVQSGR